MRFATQKILLGYNARAGLEDSLMIERGKLAPSNAEQVAKFVRTMTELSFAVATPDQARAHTIAPDIGCGFA